MRLREGGLMCIRAIVWAFDQKCPSPSAKLVLIKLADHANDDGECWPSQGHIAEDCGIDRSTVCYHIKTLVRAGYITTEQRIKENGGQLSNRYFLRFKVKESPQKTLDPPVDPINTPLLMEATPPVDGRGTPLLIQPTLTFKEEPSLEPKPPYTPRKRVGSFGGQFETWWEGYPHKVGKKAAEAKFRQAIKVATLEELAAGVQRYKRTKPDGCPWCNPATWLHQGRWQDQPATVEPAPINGRVATLPLGASLSSTTEMTWRRRLTDFQKSRFWQGNWGYPPTDSNCYAPKNLLEEYGFAHG